MENKINIKDWRSYFDKSSVTIYTVLTIASSIGYLVDIINFSGISKIVLFLNIGTIITVLGTYLLFVSKKSSLKICFGIIIYASLANVFVDSFTDPFANFRIYFFLRDSLFITFLITLSTLIIHKWHSIVICLLYIVAFISLTIITKNAFLIDSIFIIVGFMASYSLVIYYFVHILEKTTIEREENAQIIKEKSEIVNETNTILEERQQQIEEQSEQLAGQAVVLRDQSDQLVLKNIELKQLNHTKDKFLSILAHDLRNPFNIILGFTELLDLKYEKLTDENKKNYIKLLNTSARKTYNLFENLLQWSRSQTNTIEFSPKQTSISSLMNNNLMFIVESYQAKDIQITENIETNCFAYVDENMINTVVRNLLSNAMKFTPKGGTIKVSCASIKGNIVIEIADSGVGMDSQTIDSLFKIDKTASMPGTAGETGSGLGLLICKDFTEKNFGQLLVKSQLGKGSSFSMVLPAVLA